jgi:4-hydroxy-tetrahydrodipicolinate reductase
VRIALVGYGVMGRAVERLAVERGDTVVARVDRGAPPLDQEALADAEVAIEFAGPEGAAARIREATALGLPVVSGSTGFDDELAALKAEVASGPGALLHAPNLSIGVALFERVVRRAAELLNGVDAYTLHLDETHHTRKVDHPSGTARWLAEGVVEAIDRLDRWEGTLVAGPDGEDDPAEGADGEDGPAEGADGDRADDDEVADVPRRVLRVRSYREGDVAGTHTLRAVGPDDMIELTHRATSRDGFARGALTAARWLRGRRGLFTLDDVLDDLGSTHA